MTRTFTEEAKRKLIKQINDVTETTTWGRVGDFFGDMWLTVQKWTGSLNIRNYLDDVDAYHQKVLDQRDAKVSQIERIFSNVHAIDASSRSIFEGLGRDVAQELEAVKRTTALLGIPKSNFTPANLSDCISGKKKPSQLQVETNTNYSIPKQQYLEIAPRKTNASDYRSADAYNEVLEDLDVENHARYRRTDNATWCNIYVWDATKAMGCEIPHYYNKHTGEPMTRAEAIKAGTGTYNEMSANRMTSWLGKYGADYGWVECDAATAVAMANQGYPTVAAATTTGHVAMVAPQKSGDKGVMISQAGASNFEHGSLESGFGSHSSGVKYYYHV